MSLNFLLGIEIARDYVYTADVVDIIFEQADYWVNKSNPNTGIYITVKHGDENMVDANMATAHYTRTDTLKEMKYLYNQEVFLSKTPDGSVESPSYDTLDFDWTDTPDYAILYLYK